MSDDFIRQPSNQIGKTCVVCGTVIDEVINLPNFPISDTYIKDQTGVMAPQFDQVFCYCSACGHGQLKNPVDPNILYGKRYHFRTSESKTGRDGCEFFLSFLDEIVPSKKFTTVLDLGCNDLYLLKQLKEKTGQRIGIDPIWENREAENDDKDIEIIGGNIEVLDLAYIKEQQPDLIVCRHTLEHIQDPQHVLELLIDISAPDALFVFEVPGLENLIHRKRFDQIFHQHINYFSITSFQKLIKKMGCKYLKSDVNYHNWGAFTIAFEKGDYLGEIIEPQLNRETIESKYAEFKGQMAYTKILIDENRDGSLYGYGAAQMLPILGYHLGTDLSELDLVLDDDPSKHGLGYSNLDVKIAMSNSVSDLREATILITALDNAGPIMQRLLQNRPKHIILPLGFM